MSEQAVREILNLKTIAVVGCSDKVVRPSYFVSRYLKEAGYRIIPVNPGHQRILDEKCYPNLLEIREPVDTVLIFRRSEHVYPIVQDAIKIGAKAVWMQDGVEHELAFEAAVRAGLKVVMNDCMMRRHMDLGDPFNKTITSC